MNAATFDRACMAEPWPLDEAAFALRANAAKPRITLIGQEIARLVGTILTEGQAVTKRLQALKTQPEVVRDIHEQLGSDDSQSLRALKERILRAALKRQQQQRINRQS